MDGRYYSYKENDSIEAVIFDLDGTLIDTEKFFQQAWLEASAQHGYILKPEMRLKLRSLGHPFNENQFREWFGNECDFSCIQTLCKKIFRAISEERGIELKPGAKELLEFLKEKKMITVLSTSGNTERAEYCLKKTGILQYFDKLVCSDMVQYGKPSPDTYLYACHVLNIDPKNIFAVEDSPNGVSSAFAAGCKVIMVPDLTQPDDELTPKIFACVKSLLDITQLIG